MLSQKNQAADTWMLLQVSLGPAEKYIGDSASSKTIKNSVLTIRHLHFAPFSDMSLQPKICLVEGTMRSIAKLKRLDSRS